MRREKTVHLTKEQHKLLTLAAAAHDCSREEFLQSALEVILSPYAETLEAATRAASQQPARQSAKRKR